MPKTAHRLRNKKQITSGIFSLLSVRETIIFPLVTTELTIEQEQQIALLNDVMLRDGLLLCATPKEMARSPLLIDDFYPVGTIANIKQMTANANGSVNVVISGRERARLVKLTALEPYLTVHLEMIQEEVKENIETEALRRSLFTSLNHLVGIVPQVTSKQINNLMKIINLHELIYKIAACVPLTIELRQVILELEPLSVKAEYLIECLQHEVSVRELERQINAEVQQRAVKTQREIYLREQLRSIQKELGLDEDKKISDELMLKLKAAELPEEGWREAEHELERLALVPIASSEFGIIRTYLDWLANLPWNKLSGDDAIDIQYARKILDEDHYDLDKIKDRIIEYLAVKKLRQERLAASSEPINTQQEIQGKTVKRSSVREPILCLVGSPGVGKTSLGESIARALGRKFVRTSLAGMHDEAEIRGHRRTYTGALPGRIIQALKRVGTRDPVFMLDEIDKVSSDWRGDPAAALLEVLDPTQNNHFVDNYLSVPFDCSQVLFITTANTLDNIPKPLLDRMEVVRLTGYTDLDKIHIANMYLIPKQLEAHGLNKEELVFDKTVIRAIVRGYTREAGVRNLDRRIAAVCRKVATNVTKGNKEPVHLTVEQLKTYLDHPNYFDEVAERTTLPGVATGLVWTSTGGDIQFIEAAVMPGSESKLIQTGMLGDVMQESAQIALSYLRANAELLNLDPKLLEAKTIHLHMPEGAIPKDGPSAGITILTALVSLLRQQSIHSEIAMTGELTLTGKVLAVGGIKEKILAAHRARIKTVILPRRNAQDLDDVPAELRKELNYIFVDSATEVLQHALHSFEN